jgi:ADP-ribose pyrophosphatase
LATAENPDEKNDPLVFFVRQYRYPQEKIIIELPAGKLEYGEKPLDCAKRELVEETGYTSDEFTDFGLIIPTPAYDTEKIHCYTAENLKSETQRLDADEFLDVMKIPLSVAVEMIMSGEIEDSKTVAFLMKYIVKLQHLNNEQKKTHTESADK